jgi:hypothetical protein
MPLKPIGDEPPGGLDMDDRPTLDQINLVMRSMGPAVEFDRRLGVDIEEPPAAGTNTIGPPRPPRPPMASTSPSTAATSPHSGTRAGPTTAPE